MSPIVRRLQMSAHHPSSSGALDSLARIPWEGGPAYWAQFSKTAAVGWTNPSFFPMMSFSNSFSSDEEIQWDYGHGINVYHGLNPWSDYSLLLNHDMYYVGAPYADVYSNVMMPSSFNRWVGHNTPDEIDGTSATGQDAINTVTSETNGYRALNDGRFIASNYTQLVTRTDWAPYGSQLINHSGVDGVSIDMYWYTIPDSSYVAASYGNAYVSDVGYLPNPRRAASYGAMVRGLRQIDAGDGVRKPIWMFVECLSGSPGEQFVRYIDPSELKGAVMSSVIAEARGIMWFNNVASEGYAVGNVLRQAQVQGSGFAGHTQVVAMGEICAFVKNLAPIINTQSYVWDFGAACDTMLKAQGGFAYVFAMIDQASNPGSRTFTLPAGITGSSVEVVGESRTLTVNGSRQFTDTFSYEYTYHVYKIAL